MEMPNDRRSTPGGIGGSAATAVLHPCVAGSAVTSVQYAHPVLVCWKSVSELAGDVDL